MVAFAAIQAGADALYIGAPAFGARKKAANNLQDIAEVVREAHRYGVQVLVTLNTLLHDDEYPQAVQMAHELYRIGVDALIIQDLHLLDYDLPPIRLHASTQCDNRTPAQVARLRDMGFKRVVLARELGIDEIRAIREAVPDIELEAFVHGALCVCYSGCCYMSEVLAGRSANRGACAQYCRMAYDLLDAEGNEVLDDLGQPIHQRYLLSLQDMDRSAYLQELIDAGVTTFKIEGRLKDADYVTNVVAYYREKLDCLTAKRSYSETVLQQSGPTAEGGHVFTRTFVPNPEKTFHRGGIDYFLHGRTPHMANFLTPKSTGEAIGEVLEVRGNTLRIRLRPGVTLHNGDGLSLGNEGFSVNGIDGNLIRINKSLTSHSEAVSHPTSPLYRNLDVEFTKSLRCERRIPVDIEFKETEDGFELQYTAFPSGRVWVGSFSYPKEPARDTQKALATIRTQLAKLGDTPYVARDVRIETSPYFIPISTLNQWRREVLSQATAPSAVLQAEGRSYSGSSPAAPQVRSNSEPGERSLMTCRYCLLFELGHCRKTNPYPRDKEPRFLRLRTGQQVRLTFDCARCEMRIDQC